MSDPRNVPGKKRPNEGDNQQDLLKLLRDAEERIRVAEEQRRVAEEREQHLLNVLRDAEERSGKPRYKTPDDVCAHYSSGGHRDLPVRKGPLASVCGRLYNVTSAEKNVLDAAEAIGGASGEVRPPLPAVVAASGQGKTEFLKHLFLESTMHDRIIDAYNSQRPTGAAIATAVLPFYVTFNDTTGYHTNEGAVGALTNRIAASYYGMLPDLSVSCRCEDISLYAILRHIVSLEERKRQQEGILALVLVDELMKLVRKSQGTMSELVEEVCRTMDPSNKSLLFFPVVSSLQVKGLFSHVTAVSKRPLLGIPLFPCESDDIPEMVKTVAANMNKETKSRMERLRLARLYGGHYRSLEAALVHEKPPEFKLTPSRATELLEVIQHVLQNPDAYELESTMIGNQTIWDIVSCNIYGVIYRDVKVETNQVRLAISPVAMLQFAKSNVDDGRNWVRLFSELAATLIPAQTKEGFAKAWELAVPIAEVIYVGLTGRRPPYLDAIPNLHLRSKSDYYDTELRYPEGTLEECAQQLVKDLQTRRPVISYPGNNNLRGVEGGHTLYGVRCVFQMKLWETMPLRELERILEKLKSVVAGIDGGIGVLYVTGVTEDMIDKGNNVYNAHRVYVVCGRKVLSTLQPLVGTYNPACVS